MDSFRDNLKGTFTSAYAKATYHVQYSLNMPHQSCRGILIGHIKSGEGIKYCYPSPVAYVPSMGSKVVSSTRADKGNEGLVGDPIRSQKDAVVESMGILADIFPELGEIDPEDVDRALSASRSRDCV